LRVAGTFYRGHDPKWAWTPLSGEGAAIHGGRWNPRGMPALYLGNDIMGVVAEMSHGLVDRIRPLTMCAYTVDCEDIADLTTEAGRAEHGIDPAAMACPWFLIAADGGEPPSWAIARRLIAADHAGALVPSFAPQARGHHINLVLWRWGPDLPHKVEVHDPTGLLPRNQLSWADK
jgi:RES domain-containing protein